MLHQTKILRPPLYFAAAMMVMSQSVNCALLGLSPDDADPTPLILAAATAVTAVGGSGNASPGGTNVDPCANLVDGARAAALNLAGASTVFAGPAAGDSSSGNQSGSAAAARFDEPTAMTTDGSYIYFVDADNQKVRRLDPLSGAVEVFAGAPDGSTATGDDDGAGTAARFQNIADITSDCSNIYVADSSNRKIRKIDIATRMVTTLAGPAQGSTASGDVDDVGNDARFGSLGAISTDGVNLYVTQGSKVRKVVIATGQVTSILGPAAGSSANGDVDGTGNSARFGGAISGLAYADGYLYIVDRSNQKIRRANLSTLAVSVFAGPAAGSTVAGDVDAAGTSARFYQLRNITSDGTNLYVTEGDSIGAGEQIRRIEISGAAVTTLVGDTVGDVDGSGAAAALCRPKGMTVLDGALYVSVPHKIRVIR